MSASVAARSLARRLHHGREMRHIDTRNAAPGFAMVATTVRSQAATLVLRPGGAMGGPATRNEDVELWLYVVSGSGEATIEGERVPLAAGALLLVEAGEQREIRNTGEDPLVCVNVYTPPAY